ncbi:hypothetical protein TSUD_145070 [Trifolium subterraneum]|uniref:Uncharacterized protein n=1 Tax=Trifolium subterraneum TaxID=3900 RepID=A0A2Z6P7J0_TRISU|nr:hypothetical protein TSUD_145070 [Trifolium subterraneum]
MHYTVGVVKIAVHGHFPTSFTLCGGSFLIHRDDISCQHVNSSEDTLLPHNMRKSTSLILCNFSLEKWKSHTWYKL